MGWVPPGSSGKYLPGVEYPVGVKGLFYRRHSLYRVRGQLHRYVRRLGYAYAVLARYGAAETKRESENVLYRFHAALEFAGVLFIDHDVHVYVAVAGVPETRNEDVPFFGYLLEPPHKRDKFAPRHHDVFVKFRRLEFIERRRNCPP